MLTLFLCLAQITGSDVWQLDMAEFEIYTDPGIALSDQGTFAFLDWDGKAVLLVDQQGRLIQRLDKRGEGPGEFVQPGEVTFDPTSGLFVVYDIMNTRISLVNPKGEIVKEHPLPSRGSQLSVHGKTVLFARHANGQQGRTPTLVTYDLETKKSVDLWTYTPPKSKEVTTEVQGNRRINIVFSWDPGLYYRVGSHFLAVTFSDTGMVEILDRKDGRKKGSFKPELAIYPLRDEQVTEQISSLPTQFQDMARKNLVRPEHWPVIVWILVDDRDRIWVFGSRPEPTLPIPFKVYNQAGSLLGSGKVPEVIMAIRGEHWYFFEANDEEEPVLKKQKISGL